MKNFHDKNSLIYKEIGFFLNGKNMWICEILWQIIFLLLQLSPGTSWKSDNNNIQPFNSTHGDDVAL